MVFWRYALGGFRRRFRVHGGRMIRQSVIFDVGRVLFDWDLRHLFAKLIDDRDQLEWFVTNVVTPQWHFQHDAGRPLAEMVPELKAGFPGHAPRSEAHTSELQSLWRISYAAYCLKNKN